ncbi:IclR family transcriptional regulator [Rugosimonospora africana]|uniref:Transcriptional regulator n=1 Tax=Rugosimonospora africana TaxID=556532 RepID=A0A8J3QTG1_9ACTN|nr:IclR family transcriptional regulator [Rugosimonospora africana]GIH16171.1 transcriptional regulator [Rugosimonospora africana]
MPRSVPAASRALDILELFLQQPLLSAAEVVSRAGLARTTAHELLVTLVDRRYLVPVPGQPTRYRLGVRLFQLGSVFADQIDLAREAQLAANDVAAACAETVHVAVREGRDVIYIARVDSTHPVRMVSAVGRHLPAHCTGVGKMLLSGLAAEDFDALYPRGQKLPAMTRDSITSVTRLKSVLKRIRQDGLAFDDGESSEDVHCVAAGVRDQTGAIVASMSVSVPTSRWNDKTRARLSDLVRDGAARLSDNLGHRPGEG